MTSHNWTTVRDDAIEAFNGETPGAQLEGDIITFFADDPEHVIRTINRIATSNERKPVNSCWAVLRADLKRTAQADIVVDNTKGKLKAIERARTWIHNAGIHHDLERHIRAELFGDDISSGQLTDYQLSESEQAELIAYWKEQRPRGIQAEQAHEHWLTNCGGGPKRHRELLAKRRQRQEEAWQTSPQPQQQSTTSARSSEPPSNRSNSTSSKNQTDKDSPSDSQTDDYSRSPQPTSRNTTPGSTSAEPATVAAGEDIQW